MKTIKNTLQKSVLEALKSISPDINITIDNIILETPPDPQLGDAAFPMFPYSRFLKKPPAVIALEAAEILEKKGYKHIFSCSGPYLNVKIDRENLTVDVLTSIFSQDERYGENTSRKDEKVMVEFSCPNTNKPLHLGHLRNDSIGECISRTLKANSAEVCKVNLINDRGIHICKSMLAYSEFGNGETPETSGIKSDHFVGKYYVEYDKWFKKDPSVEEKARNMLLEWEKNDPETIKLWEKMNKWAIDGIEDTYKKTDISFDKVYYESRTYASGRDEVFKGLDKGVFYKDRDNTVWIDLDELNLDKKVLLRGDGTSLYLTQDLGTAIARHNDWPFDTLVYVVASEQQYHFKVLFYVLKKLGYVWAENLYHLSYGMVNLPDGKMKSREGRVVDADDLIEELKNMAINEIKEKNREEFVDDISSTAEKIALGALNYFLLSAAPTRDMIFDPAESLSFNGNTGPYLQYMGARISSILRKYGKQLNYGDINFKLLDKMEEWEIIKMLSEFSEKIEEAGKELNPSVLTGYMYELAKVFSKYYHDYPILNNDDQDLVDARIALLHAVRQVLKNCFRLTGIPFLETM